MTQSLGFTLPRDVLLNANHRHHWATKARKTSDIRTITALQARRLKPVGEQRVHITITYTFRDKRAVHDIANLHPTSKACVDGIVEARVLIDDRDRYVLGPDNRLGQPDKKIPPNRVHVEIRLDPVEEVAA